MKTYRIRFESPQKATMIDGYAFTYGGRWRTGVDGLAFYSFPDDVHGEVVQELGKDEDVLEFEEIDNCEFGKEK
jgi:hypothetical protein